MQSALARHYRYARRMRPIDWGHLGERTLPQASAGVLTRTPAGDAIRIARYRLAASESLRDSQPDVAAAYDYTGD